MFTNSDTSVLVLSFLKRDCETITGSVYFEHVCSELVSRFGALSLINIRDMSNSGCSNFEIAQSLENN